MNWQKHLPTISCGFVLLLLVSCSTLSSRSAEFPTGTFIHEKHEQFVQENVPHRNWAFRFDEDGTWAFFAGDMEVPTVSGVYTVERNLYTEVSFRLRGLPVPGNLRMGF